MIAVDAVPPVGAVEAPVCDIAIREAYGWKRFQSGAVTLWFNGWIPGLDAGGLARRLSAAASTATPGQIGGWLREIDGHYAFAATGPGWAVGAVDWVRSIPVAAASIGSRWTIDAQPERLRRAAGLGSANIDSDAALAIAMAGYTVDAATLYRGMELLVPGELVWIDARGELTRHRYYTYRPWRVRAQDAAAQERELAGITLEIMERTLTSLGGRPLVVPLSAGRDSRLVVSAARHLGYKDVRCFSYGRAGNFEADAARVIAERLGYRWAFVPASITSQHRFFAGEDYARYLEFADSGASLPFVQDMAPLLALKASGFVPDDAVIINGNSGDYIAGNHIVPELQNPARDLDPDSRWRRIINALLKKHFRLWDSLAKPANNARIAAALRRSIERAGGALAEPDSDHGLYEYAEFQDRQCKYVVTGQRIYEFLGHDWRLPLWDNAYLRFWEAVPLEQKANQSLYAHMLENTNWGSVWRDVPVNRKTVRPLWLVPLRLAVKALHAPLGAKRWHAFERQYLQYWMEATCNPACVPYAIAARDRRGARNHIAWLAALYLGRHGVDFDQFGVRSA